MGEKEEKKGKLWNGIKRLMGDDFGEKMKKRIRVTVYLVATQVQKMILKRKMKNCEIIIKRTMN
jgi:hypothetical protein